MAANSPFEMHLEKNYNVGKRFAVEFLKCIADKIDDSNIVRAARELERTDATGYDGTIYVGRITLSDLARSEEARTEFLDKFGMNANSDNPWQLGIAYSEKNNKHQLRVILADDNFYGGEPADKKPSNELIWFYQNYLEPNYLLVGFRSLARGIKEKIR
jgi:hypothetical protein